MSHFSLEKKVFFFFYDPVQVSKTHVINTQVVFRAMNWDKCVGKLLMKCDFDHSFKKVKLACLGNGSVIDHVTYVI